MVVVTAMYVWVIFTSDEFIFLGTIGLVFHVCYHMTPVYSSLKGLMCQKQRLSLICRGTLYNLLTAVCLDTVKSQSNLLDTIILITVLASHLLTYFLFRYLAFQEKKFVRRTFKVYVSSYTNLSQVWILEYKMLVLP
jgi:hypothetical protein